MQCPAEIYSPATRIYKGLPDIDYPFHDRTIVVTHCGRICLGKESQEFCRNQSRIHRSGTGAQPFSFVKATKAGYQVLRASVVSV
jgi:hypothetical protein